MTAEILIGELKDKKALIFFPQTQTFEHWDGRVYAYPTKEVGKIDGFMLASTMKSLYELKMPT
jgi:hypothetical protein